MLTFLPPHHQCIIASSCGHSDHLNGIFVALRRGHGAILFSSLRFTCSYYYVLLLLLSLLLSLSLVAAVLVVLCSGRCCCSYILLCDARGSDLEPGMMYFPTKFGAKEPNITG